MSLLVHAITSFFRWPPIKNVIMEYYERYNETGGGGNSTKIVVHGAFGNMTLIQALSFTRERFTANNFTMTQLSDWSAKGFGFSTAAVGSVAQLIFLIATFFAGFIGLGIRAVFFVTSLFYLLCAKNDPVEQFVNDLLPLEAHKKPAVLRSLRRAIEGVFFLPVKISSLHAIITLFSYSALVRSKFELLISLL